MIPADPYAGLGPATILRGNALELPLPDASVDLIVTSPPYFALRSYQDGGEHYDGQIGSEATPDAFVSTLLEATREMVRVLKPDGNLFVNLGDKYHQKTLLDLPHRYSCRVVDDLRLLKRAEIVWDKPNGLPESVNDRVRRSHEMWFHFTVSPRYFAAVDEIREPHDERYAQRRFTPAPLKTKGNADRNDGWSGVLRTEKEVTGNPLGKLPGSVREVPSAPLKVPAHLGVDHFAAFPPAWPAWIIRGWSPTGVCVECGEGRRPVVEKSLEVRNRNVAPIRHATDPLNERPADYYANTQYQGSTHATITGYACACPTPDAPTRPAVVLDPFGGTGTTAMAARALGRHGITVDLSADYCRLARWRVQDMDELAAVRGIPRQGRKADEAQVSLLDMLDGEAS